MASLKLFQSRAYYFLLILMFNPRLLSGNSAGDLKLTGFVLVVVVATAAVVVVVVVVCCYWCFDVFFPGQLARCSRSSNSLVRCIWSCRNKNSIFNDDDFHSRAVVPITFFIYELEYFGITIKCESPLSLFTVIIPFTCFTAT